MSPRIRSALMLVAQLAIVAGVALFGSLFTAANVEGWYQDADKAPWSPPNWLFGPVWTVLYTTMAVAIWLVWRRRNQKDVRRACALYVAQLVLNSIWTPVFFGLYPVIGVAALWIALVIIAALDVLVVLTILSFRRVEPVAGRILLPYLAWALFATTLNAAVAVLN